MQQGLELGPAKQEIINYVRNNPGTSKADIIRHLKNRRLASRITVLEYIKDLEETDLIYEKKERPNSQSFMMYVNDENKLTSVLRELEDFKVAFFNLLEKSKEIINNKDYSTDAKGLRIREPNPANWSKDERRRFFDSEHGKRSESERRFFDLMDQFRKMKMEEDASKIKKYIDYLIHNYEEIRNYKTAFLIPYPIHIFFAFTDIILLRSITVWSPSIEDKQILSQLYLIVQSKITEVQTLLSEFFSSIKILGMDFRSDWFGGVAVFFINLSRDPNMSFFNIDRYSVLGMDLEIRSVIDSLRKLSKEIEGYNIRFERIFLLDSLLRVKNGLESTHKKEKKSDVASRQIIERIQSASKRANLEQEPDLERKLLDQGTHFRMFEIIDMERVVRKSKPGEKLIEIELYMPGIEFPLSRNKMIEFAQRKFLDRDAFLLNIFQSLDAEAYETKDSLEHALTLLFNTSRKDFFGRNQTFDHVTIYTIKEEISKHQKNIDKKVMTEH